MEEHFKYYIKMPTTNLPTQNTTGIPYPQLGCKVRLLIDKTSDKLLVFSAGTEITMSDPSNLNLLGYSVLKFVHNGQIQIITPVAHGTDYEGVDASAVDLVEGVDYEIEYNDAVNIPFWLETGTPFRNQDRGEMAGLNAVKKRNASSEFFISTQLIGKKVFFPRVEPPIDLSINTTPVLTQRVRSGSTFIQIGSTLYFLHNGKQAIKRMDIATQYPMKDGSYFYWSVTQFGSTQLIGDYLNSLIAKIRRNTSNQSSINIVQKNMNGDLYYGIESSYLPSNADQDEDISISVTASGISAIKSGQTLINLSLGLSAQGLGREFEASDAGRLITILGNVSTSSRNDVIESVSGSTAIIATDGTGINLGGENTIWQFNNTTPTRDYGDEGTGIFGAESNEFLDIFETQFYFSTGSFNSNAYGYRITFWKDITQKTSVVVQPKLDQNQQLITYQRHWINLKTGARNENWGTPPFSLNETAQSLDVYYAFLNSVQSPDGGTTLIDQNDACGVAFWKFGDVAKSGSTSSSISISVTASGTNEIKSGSASLSMSMTQVVNGMNSKLGVLSLQNGYARSNGSDSVDRTSITQPSGVTRSSSFDSIMSGMMFYNSGNSSYGGGNHMTLQSSSFDQDNIIIAGWIDIQVDNPDVSSIYSSYSPPAYFFNWNLLPSNFQYNNTRGIEIFSTTAGSHINQRNVSMKFGVFEDGNNHTTSTTHNLVIKHGVNEVLIPKSQIENIWKNKSQQFFAIKVKSTIGGSKEIEYYIADDSILDGSSNALHGSTEITDGNWTSIGSSSNFAFADGGQYPSNYAQLLIWNDISWADGNEFINQMKIIRNNGVGAGWENYNPNNSYKKPNGYWKMDGARNSTNYLITDNVT